MGICASSQITRSGRTMKWPPTAMVIDLDGGLQEFKKPIKTAQIMTQNPNCFLCSSETMFLGSHAPPMATTDELQLEQIYFLLPISKSQTPLCLPDLCALAIKASSALNTSLFSDKSGVGRQGRCRVPSGFDAAEKGSQAVPSGGQRVEFNDQQS